MEASRGTTVAAPNAEGTRGWSSSRPAAAPTYVWHQRPLESVAFPDAPCILLQGVAVSHAVDSQDGMPRGGWPINASGQIGGDLRMRATRCTHTCMVPQIRPARSRSPTRWRPGRQSIRPRCRSCTATSTSPLSLDHGPDDQRLLGRVREDRRSERKRPDAVASEQSVIRHDLQLQQRRHPRTRPLEAASQSVGGGLESGRLKVAGACLRLGPPRRHGLHLRGFVTVAPVTASPSAPAGTAPRRLSGARCRTVT